MIAIMYHILYIYVNKVFYDLRARKFRTRIEISFLHKNMSTLAYPIHYKIYIFCDFQTHGDSSDFKSFKAQSPIECWFIQILQVATGYSQILLSFYYGQAILLLFILLMLVWDDQTECSDLGTVFSVMLGNRPIHWNDYIDCVRSQGKQSFHRCQIYFQFHLESVAIVKNAKISSTYYFRNIFSL